MCNGNTFLGEEHHIRQREQRQFAHGQLGHLAEYRIVPES